MAKWTNRSQKLDLFITGQNIHNERSDVSKLEAEKNKNYQAVANYYAKKKQAFLKRSLNKKEKDISQLEKDFVQEMEQLINEEWDATVQYILNNVVTSKSNAAVININGTKLSQKFTNKQGQILEIPVWLQDKLQALNGKKGIHSELGLLYEEFLVTRIFEKGTKVKNAALSSILKSMGSSFGKTYGLRQTGGIRMNAALHADDKEIRADFGIGVDEWGYDENGLSAELEANFSVEHIPSDYDFENDPILGEYLKSNMFGFSVKKYPYGQMGHFTSASGLQNLINDKFNTRAQGGNGILTWNATYSYYFMLMMVSRYLINILGPIDIAYIFGNTFIWADNFLNANEFEMNLYAHAAFPNDEVMPYVASGNIYRRWKSQTARTYLGAQQYRYWKENNESGKIKGMTEKFKLNFSI